MADEAAWVDTELSSAHAFIKALKSSPGSSKIPQDFSSKLALATRALSNQTIYLPNRTQIIQDWIIETWNRSNASSTPLLDPAYHQLFHKTLASTAPTVQIGPILSNFLQAAKEVNNRLPKNLLPLACHSFRRLTNGLNTPTKLETWIATWKKLLDWMEEPVLPAGWLEIVQLILAEWPLDHGEENMRKLSLSLRPTLTRYLYVRLAHPEIRLYDSIYIEKLLPWTALLAHDALKTVLDTSTPTIATFLGPLLQQYIALLQRERYRIYTQPSSSKDGIDVYLASRLRSSVRSGLLASLAVAQSFDSWSTQLSTHTDLWQVIHEWGGYIETEAEWRELLANCSTLAQHSLQEHESDRREALEALIVYEEIDHGAAAIGSDVVKWCLACPIDIRPSSERLLVAVATYHGLTRSVDAFFESLDQACESLIQACDSYKSIRAVYSLIADGPLSSSSLRMALKRNATRDTKTQAYILSRISRSQEAVGTSIDDIVAEAAMFGLRSRMLKTVCNGKRLLSETPAFAPMTSIEKPSKRFAWARQVHRAAQLRLSNIARREEAIEIEQGEAMTDKLPELKAEKTIHDMHQLQTQDLDLRQIIDHNTSGNLLENAGLLTTLGTCLNADQWLELLSNRPEEFLPSADLLEFGSFRDAVDRYIRSNPTPGRWMSLASHETQRSLFEDIFTKKSSFTSVEEQWLQQCVTADTVNASIVKPELLNACWRHTVRSSASLTLLTAFYRKACARHLNGVVQSALSESGLPFDNAVSRLQENGCDAVVMAMSAFMRTLAIESDLNSLSAIMRARLLATLHEAMLSVHSFLQSGGTCSSNLITWALAIQATLRWLGVSDAGTSVGEQVIERDLTSLAIDTSVLALQLVQKTGVSYTRRICLLQEVAARCIVEQRKDLLHAVLLDASADDFMHLLEQSLALSSIQNIPGQRLLIAEALEIDTFASREAIRQQGFMIIDLIQNEYILQALRRFIVSNPYVLGARDVIGLLKNLAGVLLQCSTSQAFEAVIAIAIALLRHRRDSVVQQASLLVDICRSSFPLFVNRPKRSSCLSSSHANLFARFLTLLRSDKESDAPVLVKHLPAVLLDYVRAVADPRGRISIEVRQELKQGLAGICALVTAGGRMHSRGREGEALGDAFGLTDGAGAETERDIWADLWQSWANKRYTGQG